MQLELIYLIIGISAGLVIGWMYANQQSSVRINRAEATADARENIFKESREMMKSEMRNIATEVNQASSETFLQLAGERFKAQKIEIDKDLEAKKMAVDDLVKPIKIELEKLQVATHQIEKEREGAYEGLKRQITGLSQQATDLRDTNVQLSTALRGSIKARGNWGQISLKNIAEASGMLEHCDFDVEKTLLSGKGGGRVDLVAHIPDGGDIPVDAKVPLASYWDALEMDDVSMRTQRMTDHVKDVKNHIDDLSKRDYPSMMSGSDFTVMFVPAEPILSAAFEIDPSLQEYAFSKQILIATPVTLIALLKTVGIYWQQVSIAENAKEIHATAREFYDRVSVFGEHLQNVGGGLKTAIDAYNKSVGSFERNVSPSGRRLEQLKVTENSTKTLKEISIIDKVPRIIENLPKEKR